MVLAGASLVASKVFGHQDAFSIAMENVVALTQDEEGVAVKTCYTSQEHVEGEAEDYGFWESCDTQTTETKIYPCLGQAYGHRSDKWKSKCLDK